MPGPNDPWGAFDFIVEIDGIANAGFAEIGGLSMATDVIEYREGGDKTNGVRKLTGLTRYGDVTLRRGQVADLALYQWLRATVDGAPDAARSVVIMLLDDARQPVRRWILTRARIIKHVSGPFNARSSAVAIEEIILAHERLEIA